MLSQNEYEQLCRTLGLSSNAISVIDEVRGSPPSRRVRSAAGNVSVRYPSQKMGVIIQAESHRNELAGIYEKEHDSNTLEYYDQPPSIKLVYKSKSGRRVGVWHTPDFFVIRNDGVGWEEWKMEEELLRLSQKMPHRYVRAEDNHWHCPPGERCAKRLGFFYHIRSSSEIDWIFQRNMLFLEDYFRADCPSPCEETVQTVSSLIEGNPGITLKDLIKHADSDDIYSLVATEKVYVDIRAVPLAELERVQVFLNEEIARAYSVIPETLPLPASDPVHIEMGISVVWDENQWTVVNLGKTKTTLLSTDGQFIELPHDALELLIKQGKLRNFKTISQERLRELFSKASLEDLKEANRRYAVIAPCLNGTSPKDKTVPGRTLRRWLKKWRDAEQTYGCGYVGLLPQWNEKGNRKRKMPASTISVLEEFIINDYETLKQKRKYEIYGALVCACEERGLFVPSYKTFVDTVNRRPRYKQTMKRKGRRAAYVYEPFYRELTLTTPRHGDRPFEIGHIDHTQFDIELICSSTGRNLGRPWATFLIDAFSRRLLAAYLTFDSPSYRSCMMILRECVHRHSRLPQIIVVDGGKEFESIYFETLLARYECSKKTRPSSKCRFGSVCERLFGTTNTRFIHNLTGNTQIMRNVRQTTKAVNPKKHARWTLGRLYSRLCEWAYEVYDTIEHPALHESPRKIFNTRLKECGRRPHRLIPYDEDFRIFTLPTTKKGTSKVMPRLGVKIQYIYYWSDTFLDPEVENKQVPVRFDPFDAATAYAFVKGYWVRCISEHYTRFSGRSQREIMFATQELRMRNRRHNLQFTVTARKLADFLASLEAEEALLEQRLKDRQIKEVHTAIEGHKAVVSEREEKTKSTFQQKFSEENLVIYEDY